MKYQNYSGLPKRGYPLNGIPLYGLPGTVPVTPSLHYTGGGYFEPDYDWKKRERKRKILREITKDDQEIFELLAMITPFLN